MPSTARWALTSQQLGKARPDNEASFGAAPSAAL